MRILHKLITPLKSVLNFNQERGDQRNATTGKQLDTLSGELQAFIKYILLPQSIPFTIQGNGVTIKGKNLKIDAANLPNGLVFNNSGWLNLEDTERVGARVKFNGRGTVMFGHKLLTMVTASQFAAPDVVYIVLAGILPAESTTPTVLLKFPLFKLMLTHLSISECEKMQMLFALNGLPAKLFGSIAVYHPSFYNYQAVFAKPWDGEDICIVDSIILDDSADGKFSVHLTDLKNGKTYFLENLDFDNTNASRDITVIHPGVVSALKTKTGVGM